MPTTPGDYRRTAFALMSIDLAQELARESGVTVSMAAANVNGQAVYHISSQLLPEECNVTIDTAMKRPTVYVEKILCEHCGAKKGWKFTILGN